jgi:hypothetical protein
MRRDLYFYGRSLRREAAATTVSRTASATFVCTGCGCSATATDQGLLLAIGWKLLPGEPRAVERPALCPPCSRKRLTGVF